MTMTSGWRFAVRHVPALPPLAWIAWVRDSVVEVACGQSVRSADAGFFSGTWAGTDEFESLPDASTVFGSGIVARDAGLVVVTAGQAMDGVWFVERTGEIVLANSFLGLLAAAGLELDPAQPYPRYFVPLADLRWMPEDPRTGLINPYRIDVPTKQESVSGLFFENLGIDRERRVQIIRKPREAPFASFADFRDRLVASTASLLANAPNYEPVVSLSGGYDSTAVAAIAVQLGCRRAVSMDAGRLFPSGELASDDGRRVADALGLDVQVFDRMAYRQRTDFPEAEFLAGGMSGEDVPLTSFEPAVRRTILMTGFWTGQFWVKSKVYPPRVLHPGDLSGFSLTEFVLRNDVIHVPVPTFGAAQPPGFRQFFADDDMLPYTVGGEYDRPIPRRLAEEGGVPRGIFAAHKRAGSVMLQRDPGAWFSPSTASAIREFAAAEGRNADLRNRTKALRRQRAITRVASVLGGDRAVRGLSERRRALVHFEPELGSIVLRWAVERTRSRYDVAKESIGS